MLAKHLRKCYDYFRFLAKLFFVLFKFIQQQCQILGLSHTGLETAQRSQKYVLPLVGVWLLEVAHCCWEKLIVKMMLH